MKIAIPLLLVCCCICIASAADKGDTDCGSRPADIYFLLDASGSVYASGFQKQLDFVKAFANKFDIGPDAVRVGVSTFADDVQVKFWMDGHLDRDGLLDAISNVDYSRGVTRTDLGLRAMRQNAFTTSHGGRPDVKDILIVTTDGDSTKPDLTKVEADLIHQENIDIFVIGVGANVQRSELEVIARRPEDVYTVDSFDVLDDILADLAISACDAAECPLGDQLPNCVEDLKKYGEFYCKINAEHCCQTCSDFRKQQELLAQSGRLCASGVLEPEWCGQYKMDRQGFKMCGNASTSAACCKTCPAIREEQAKVCPKEDKKKFRVSGSDYTCAEAFDQFTAYQMCTTSYKRHCCRACLERHTDISEYCSYGDRAARCPILFAKEGASYCTDPNMSSNRLICCETCKDFPTMTYYTW